MFEKIKEFLNKIRHSDQRTRKRWLIISTTTTMILIVGLWLIWINLTTKPAQEAAGQEIKFWQIFKNGLVVVGQSTKEEIKKFISEIAAERTVTVEP